MASERVPGDTTSSDAAPTGLTAILSSSCTLIILAVLVLFFSIYQGTRFANPSNFQNIVIDASQLLLLAVGVTFVIITAGIDLSIGSVLILSSVVAAKVIVRFAGTPDEVTRVPPNEEWAIPLGLLAGVLTGLGCGLVNGLLVTRLKMPSFIVTLGTLGIALGVAQLLSGGVNIPNLPRSVQREFGLRELVGLDLYDDYRLRLTPPMLIAFVIVVIAAVTLRFTRFGRYTYAIGSNAAAARRVGINVDNHLLKIYGLSGLLAGVAGCFDLFRFGTASVGSHQADNLAAISAAVIGGTSLFGGLGTIGGSVIGAFIPAVLRTGLVISRVQSFWQNVAIGVVLILAVFLDQRRRRAEERM